MENVTTIEWRLNCIQLLLKLVLDRLRLQVEFNNAYEYYGTTDMYCELNDDENAWCSSGRRMMCQNKVFNQPVVDGQFIGSEYIILKHGA